MNNHKTTNSLLGIMAVSLILIALKLYNPSFITSAEAQLSSDSTSKMVPVAIHAQYGSSWYPCKLTSGDKLVVEVGINKTGS